MDNDLAHRVYAGADLFLMPSAFEPCGLSQLIALRYGTVPVVRETGGLRDTVLSYNEFTGEGNGFSFFNYNAHDMLHVLQRALGFYRHHKDVWTLLQQRGMEADYSWLNSSRRYLDLYKKMMPVLLGTAIANGTGNPPAKAGKAAEINKDHGETDKKPAKAAKTKDIDEAALPEALKPSGKRQKGTQAKPVAGPGPQENAAADSAKASAGKPRKPKAEKAGHAPAEEPKASDKKVRTPKT